MRCRLQAAFFLIGIALCWLSVGASAAVALTALSQSLLIDKYGFTVRFPAGWSARQQGNLIWLVDAPIAEARGTALDRLAVLYITVEVRGSHAEAVQRLHDMAVEYDEPTSALTVAGWPALQRQIVVDKPEPVEGEATSPGEKVLRIVTAIAAGNLMIREEAQMPPSTESVVQDDVRAIETGLILPSAGSSGQSQGELQNLRLIPSLLIAPKPITLGGGRTTVSGIGASPSAVSAQLVLSSSEPQIAVSGNGQNVFIASNQLYRISTNGGQTFGATFQIPNPKTSDGDASVAFGKSGNFYGATLNVTVGAIPLNAATPATLTGPAPLSFVANAYNCAATGVSLCGFVLNRVLIPDQEQIAADRWNAGTGGDQVYVVWRNGGVNWNMACSSNSGQTFQVSQNTVPGDHARVTVGSDGSVYVSYVSATNVELDKYSSCNQGLARVSSGFPVTVATGIAVQCPVPGLDRCGGDDMQSAVVAVDDTPGLSNHVYLSYAQNTAFSQATAAGNENIVVRDSFDGGQTWPASRSQIVNAAVNARRFLPWICTSNGTAWVSWYDRGAATAPGAASNDLTNYFLDSVRSASPTSPLVAGRIINLSVNPDPQCGNRWPQGEQGLAANDATLCSTPQPSAGKCQLACANTGGCPGGNNGTGALCNFNAPACTAPGETCQAWGRGAPKYGDYNGNACTAAAAGRIYNAWTSATAPPGAPPATGLGLYFAFTDATTCGGAGQQCCVAPQCNSNLACENNVCSCGFVGEPCCGGASCNAGAQCNSKSICACGGANEPCCSSGKQCSSGLACSSKNGLCVATCGNAGQACCGGTTCNALSVCVQGQCVCGGRGQPCCAPGGTCNTTLTCSAGLCQAQGNTCASCTQTGNSCWNRCAKTDTACQCACQSAETSCLNANSCEGVRGVAGPYDACASLPKGAPGPLPQPANFLRDREGAGKVFNAAYVAPNGSGGITKSQADDILEELRKIRELLETQRAQPGQAAGGPPQGPITIDIGPHPNSIGSSAAPAVMLEFTDYQCPFCAAFHAQTFPQLKSAYVDTGKLRIISRDLPLSMHQNALKAAEAARCAGDQGKFWDMRNALISNSADVSQTAVTGYVHVLSLDAGKFQSCLDKDEHAADIQKDIADAGSLQIDGTPTFVIGTVTNGRLTGTIVSGAQPYSTFEDLIKTTIQSNHQIH